MQNTPTKLTFDGKVISDCPKCKGEDSLYVSSHLKWGKINKWQHFIKCNLCSYESKVD